MKRIILISVAILLYSNALACSCGSVDSFCYTHDSFSITASCVVVDAFPHGISLKILHLLHGDESRDTITVWDKGGPYDMCNDSLSDASAAYFGSIGDTLILALPKIDSLETTWDVLDDYRTPGLTCTTYRLSVTNNIVRGFISGSSYCYFMNNCVNAYDYDDFIVDFPINSLSCQTWVDTDELSPQERFRFYPNPASDNITFSTSDNGTLRLSNELGQVIAVFSIHEDETQIPTDQLKNGIYFLTFQTARSSTTRKIIVQH